MNSKSLWIPGILFVLGIAAAYFTAIYIRQSKCTARAKGTITEVDLEKHLPSHGGDQYVLHISFPAGGETITTEKRFPTVKGSFKKGDEVTINYNPKNPRRCYIEGYATWTAFR